MTSLDYWQKQEKPLFPDLIWNIPEQKMDIISVVGGSKQSFSSAVRTSEYLSSNFPIKTVKTILPDSLRGISTSVKNLENIIFADSTITGTFAKSRILSSAVKNADFSLFIGDFSKNAETATALSEIAKEASSPLLITRDAVDLLSSDAEKWLDNSEITILASLAQLQKLFRAIYYPKMLLLSTPLLPVLEILHKFTLSYPCKIVTFHQKQIIVATDGDISTTPIEKTNYSPISLWSGNLAANIVGMNVFNPKKPFEATTAAVLH